MINDPELLEVVASQEIDGITYTSTKWPCTKALSLASRAAMVLGEGGLKAIATAPKGESFVARVSALIAQGEGVRAIMLMSRAFEADQSLPFDLLKEVKASRVLPHGKAGTIGKNFDGHFQGEFLHLFKVLEFTLRHNFLGFMLGASSKSGPPTKSETVTEEPSSTPLPKEE